MMKIFLPILSYFFGSIPSGYIFFRISERKDIRNYGSGSTGATNLFRLKGWKLAVPALLIDFFKGSLPVFLALKTIPDLRLVLLCGLLAVTGHCFPVYLKFKGGKGVATSMGVYAALVLKPFLFSLAVFIIIILLTRYVSLGSLLASFSFPFIVWISNNGKDIIFLGAILFALIAVRHSGNIYRLVKGQERRLGSKTR